MNSMSRIKKLMVLIIILLFLSSNHSFVSSGQSNNDEELDGSVETINSFFPSLLIKNERLVLYQAPTTPPPQQGYPVLFLLHGASQYPFS